METSDHRAQPVDTREAHGVTDDVHHAGATAPEVPVGHSRRRVWAVEQRIDRPPLRREWEPNKVQDALDGLRKQLEQRLAGS